MILFRRILLGLCAATLLSNSAFADTDYVVVKGVKVDGGGMSCLGLTLTTVDKKFIHNKYLTYAGWGLVIGGLVIGSGSTTNTEVRPVRAKHVWNSMRTESRLATKNLSLIDETSGIVAASSRSKIEVSKLAALIEKVDAITDQARKLGQTISVDEVVNQVGAIAQDRAIVANMAQIALIAQ